MKSLLEKNDIEMYLTHHEEKYVVADILIRNLKKKIYEHLTSVSEKVYIDKSDDRVDKNNNTHNRAIKMKPIDVKSNTFIKSSK